MAKPRGHFRQQQKLLRQPCKINSRRIALVINCWNREACNSCMSHLLSFAESMPLSCGYSCYTFLSVTVKLGHLWQQMKLSFRFKPCAVYQPYKLYLLWKECHLITFFISCGRKKTHDSSSSYHFGSFIVTDYFFISTDYLYYTHISKRVSSSDRTYKCIVECSLYTNQDAQQIAAR